MSSVVSAPEEATHCGHEMGFTRPVVLKSPSNVREQGCVRVNLMLFGKAQFDGAYKRMLNGTHLFNC